MFIGIPISEVPFLDERRSDRLLDIEQRMNEFLVQKSGEAGNEALELVRIHRDEIRRELTGRARRTKKA